MERKIGEIFEYNGEWYQCVEDTEDISCVNCCFYNGGIKLCTEEDVGDCANKYRSDAKSICFKKLEKVGEPYTVHDHSLNRNVIVQDYKLYEKSACYNGNEMLNFCPYGKEGIVAIEIKQNKEDMEEKNEIKLNDLVNEYVNELIDFEEFKKGIKEWCEENSNIKSVGNNLKPFSLEAAKAGKPVCTRDGRKARIIAFDRRLFYKNVSYPILALAERSDGEDDVCGYNEKGKVLIEDGAEYKDDLMMLPEKHEGWVNVYKMKDGKTIISQYPYESEDACRNVARPENGYIDTIRIEWYE